MNAETTAFHLPAPLWRRLAALGYDLFAMAAVVMVTIMVCLLLTAGTLDPSALWYRLTLLAALGAYFLASWLRGGQTLGMRPWRIRVCTASGAAPRWRQALIRFAAAAAPLLLLALTPWTGAGSAIALVLLVWALDFAWAAFDPRRRALHDLAAGTELRQRL
ncbi:RDD family protein [Oleiagrimonas sp. C23AA]|uniref:RDD family protein n=1 Tax=Oleiagrimonas sp. C23AA TaxID=2719047 RepID=UPI0014224BC5|nr:RDD family protein [Oleiagrimonas sp. C23AA]NII12077.1 RDD family protein [Oleiagrimonas sp. C23AA]